MNIIGLGNAGCKIAELFKKYPQYTVFKIDSDEKLKRKKNCFYIPKRSSVELYDANPIDIKKLKKNLDEDEEVYLITCGCGKVSACTLWILRQLTDRKIKIIYIKPDTTSIDDKSVLINRAHFHILQEYTRSGVFYKMYIIDNKKMKDIIGKTSILNFYPKINNFIVNTIHWMNIYMNTDPVFDTYRDEYITSRICSFGIIDLERESMAETYSLKKCNQIKYFYGVNRITIESDEELIEKLNRVTSKESKDASISYGVYSTDLDVGFSFAIKSSSEIQLEE
tara:strand:+ start:645 stop:1487 length:843 start_codon:yes stop_codon:yes gene_type:complete